MRIEVLTNLTHVKPWYVYMIETDKGQLYTGISTDVARRFSEHLACFQKEPKAQAKKGAKYFRTQRPSKIVFEQALTSRALATQRERAIKAMSRQQKLTLISFSN